MKVRATTFVKTFAFMSIIFGGGVVQAASRISVIQELFAFTVYALVFSLYAASGGRNILGDPDDQKKLSRLSTVISIIIATISIFVIFSENGIDLSRIFLRSREIRHAYFQNERSVVANYFVLLMSSHFIFFMALCAAFGRSKGAIFAVFLASFLADSVTSGRSSVLSALIATIFYTFVYRPVGVRSIFLLTFFAAIFVSFSLLGQGGVAAALQIRLMNYISAPIYLANILDEENSQWAIISMIEFLTYPFKMLTGGAIFSFDTSYEYEFFFMPSGQIGNVVLPIYGGITGLTAALILCIAVCGSLLMLKYVSLISNQKSQKLVFFILVVSFFGPISLMRSPFLSERIWFLFFLVLLLSEFYLRLYKKRKPR